jgi:hypothetical protein
MRLWEAAFLFVGQIWNYLPRAGQWWPTINDPNSNTQGAPPVDFTMMTQAQLLAQFSDAIGPDGITPRSMRNFVGSTVTMNPGGIPPAAPLPLPGWTTATRPTGMVGPCIGFNYDLNTLDMWNDQTQSWVNPAFNGGNVDYATSMLGGLSVQGPFIANLPTTCSGQASGTLWNNGNTVSICP